MDFLADFSRKNLSDFPDFLADLADLADFFWIFENLLDFPDLFGFSGFVRIFSGFF